MYIILITVILFSIMVYMLIKYQNSNTFVNKNGICMQYNIYKIHNKEPSNSLPSSQILEWSFQSYNVSKILYEYTRDVQTHMGINQTIWAIKKTNDKINWEYYFYGLSPINVTYLKNLYDYNKKASINSYYEIIHKKYFPLEEININKLDEYKNNLIIFSVDVHPKFFDKKKVGNIDIYLDTTNTKTIVTPYKCTCHSFSKNIKYKGTNHIYDMKDYNQKIMMLSQLKQYINEPDKILINNWENINHINIIDKEYANSISINYFGFDTDTFIDFLIKHKYENKFIQNIIKNKNNLNHLSFEFSEDYDKDTMEITKTTIYGSF